MNMFMIETELDDLGRPVRIRRERLMTHEEFQRRWASRTKLQRMMVNGLITDDSLVVRTAVTEMQVYEVR